MPVQAPPQARPATRAERRAEPWAGPLVVSGVGPGVRQALWAAAARERLPLINAPATVVAGQHRHRPPAGLGRLRQRVQRGGRPGRDRHGRLPRRRRPDLGLRAPARRRRPALAPHAGRLRPPGDRQPEPAGRQPRHLQARLARRHRRHGRLRRQLRDQRHAGRARPRRSRWRSARAAPPGTRCPDVDHARRRREPARSPERPGGALARHLDRRLGQRLHRARLERGPQLREPLPAHRHPRAQRADALLQPLHRRCRLPRRHRDRDGRRRGDRRHARRALRPPPAPRRSHPRDPRRARGRAPGARSAA